MNSLFRLTGRQTARFAALTLLVLAVPAFASAAAGDLDPSFGSGGKVITDFSGGLDYGLSVAIQPDGKLVTAGSAGLDFAVARHNADGSLDGSFGSGGKVLTDFGGTNGERAFSVAIQPDGKVIAGGATWNGDDADLALARYTADGALDSSFGAGGRVVTALHAGSAERIFSIALQGDGKIVAAGSATYRVGDSTAELFEVFRYNADGTLDTTFGLGGLQFTDFGGLVEMASGVAIQPDGKIVAAGLSSRPGDTNFALARYTPDGAPDLSFGQGGAVVTDLGSPADIATGLALQPDGKIVVAGWSTASGTTDLALVRYDADGSLDGTFGSGGRVWTDFGSTVDQAFDVAIDPEGRIVVGGSSGTIAPVDFVVARYNTDGTLDGSFGSSGKVVTDLGAREESALSVAVQPDRNIVVVGSTAVNGTPDVALVRYLGEGEPDGDGDGIPDTQDPDTIATVVSALPDGAFSTGEHARPVLNKLDEIEALIASGDLATARTELQNLRRKVDGCGITADTNDWIVDCAAQLDVRALIDDLLAHLGS